MPFINDLTVKQAEDLMSMHGSGLISNDTLLSMMGIDMQSESSRMMAEYYQTVDAKEYAEFAGSLLQENTQKKDKSMSRIEVCQIRLKDIPEERSRFSGFMDDFEVEHEL